MIFKIAFRNFFLNWKMSLLVILGTMIATMLVVGALSLNDSVDAWFAQKILRNFGSVDIVAKDKKDTFFFPKALDVEKVGDYFQKLKEEGTVKDYTFVSLVSSRIEKNGNFFDIFAIGYDDNLLRFSGQKVSGVVISKDLADALNIKRGDIINLVTVNGKQKVKVDYIGTLEFNFRGETGMTNGSIFMPMDMLRELRLYANKLPNTVFASLNVPISEHELIAKKIEDEIDLRVTPTKYNLKYSPLNRVIGYLFLGFSGFALLSSFLFISNFFGVLAEDRRKVLGTLRALGYSQRKIASILFVEGFTYLLFSSLIGATAGIGFGRYLLSLVNKMPSLLASDTALPETIYFTITFKTILFGILISLVLPIFILLYRSVSFSKISPVVLLSREEILPKRKFLYVFFFLPIFLYFVKPYYSLVSLIAIVPLFVKKDFLQVVSGALVILITYFQIGTGGGWDYLARAGLFLLGSIYIVFGILPCVKNYFKHFRNISTVLALSYIDKQRWRNFVVFLVYSVITLVILLTAILPTSIFNYIDNKTNIGILGYNFLIVENPLKIFFGGSTYDRDEQFKSLFNNLVKIQLVDAKYKDRNVVVILAGKDIVKSLKIEGINTLYLENKEGIGSKDIFTKDATYTLQIKGILPGISKKISENFVIKELYDPKSMVVPFDGILVYNQKIPGALQGYAGVVKDSKAAQRAKKIVYERFDGPFYVTEELDKVFNSVRYFVSIAIQLFYFGFVSGFSGLTILSIKNVYSRRRIIGSLKAIGVNKMQVFKAFLFESIMIVTIAILTAISTVTFITLDFAKLIVDEIPDFSITVPWGQVFLILGGVYLITIIFTIYPANLAQKVDPAEAIRVFD
ncbi:ABC transporter permease [Thermosipho atlanticus]|uniref:Putative ABC transport system permease protein n=1 Tax=Thermosipho atlanticus DSM 15807 TaxID=1123380 RepID=A0A1M5RQA6_9BACT|nr:ABC transporter permease [Thermosipho atlanticus]SHH28321.1 putative ABC transport system permease protein [Thermosipho atlanticus DSM 15807]